MLLGHSQHAAVRDMGAGGRDFNCNERYSEERDMLGGLVAGNAVAREKSHPRSKSCTAVRLTILSILSIVCVCEKTGKYTAALSTLRVQKPTCWTMLLISTKAKAHRF